MNQLTHWIAESGGYISPKVEVTAIPDRGNSIAAASSISKGEKLVSLPRQLLINVQSLGEPDLTSHQALAKFLLTSDSLWIETLPKNFDSIPVCWSPSELKHLPEKNQKHVAKQLAQISIDHKLACPNQPFDRFVWAWLCVNSRCLYWDVGREREENMTMAPFIDFLNHDTDQSKTVRVKTGLGMALYASKDYTKGEEICLNYGPHENAFLLCEYGFVAQDNPWDYIDLTPQLEPLLKDHESVLRDLGYWGDYTISSDGPSFRTLVACEALKNLNLKLIVDGLVEPEGWSPVLTTILDDLEVQFKKTVPRQELRHLYDGYLSIIYNSRSSVGT